MVSESLKLENLVVVALLLALLLLSVACGDAPAVSSPAELPAAVRVEVVQPQPVGRTLDVPGLVESRHRIELAFRVTGFIERFAVEEGDRVEAGAVLAELDRDELEREVRAARAALARATAHAADAARTFARQKELLARSSTSRQSFDRAQGQLDMARADEREARVGLEMAEDRLAKAVLKAPVSGVIEDRLLDPHELATAQTPVLVLTDLDRVKVRAAISDAQLGRLRVGAEARVRTPLWPERTFTGRVARIGVAANPATRTVPFEVEIENPDHALRPELVVSVQVPLGAPAATTLVPLSAVLRDVDTRPFCFVAVADGEATRVERRPVELGSLHGERVAVRAGLAPGERLVTRGQFFVRDGDAVQVLPEE